MLFRYIGAVLCMTMVVWGDTNISDRINIQTQKVADYTLLTKDTTKGLIYDHLMADTAIALWGFKYWHWGTQSFHVTQEPWFDQDSKTGGSDKTGHFYMTYLLSRVLASRMEDRGCSLEMASLLGSLSGMTAMTLLEVGDGTSEYGFSKEDLLADFIGASLAYLIRANPDIDKFVDVRLEYFPTSDYLSDGDATTDYSGMRHLIALKAEGFDRLKNSFWGLFELQVGYYSRGYRSYDTSDQSQHLYVGLGLSLSNLANRTGVNALKNIFEFYQPGGTYVETDMWSR